VYTTMNDVVSVEIYQARQKFFYLRRKGDIKMAGRRDEIKARTSFSFIFFPICLPWVFPQVTDHAASRKVWQDQTRQESMALGQSKHASNIWMGK
jgi:hypothetical protein